MTVIGIKFGMKGENLWLPRNIILTIKKAKTKRL